MPHLGFPSPAENRNSATYHEPLLPSPVNLATLQVVVLDGDIEIRTLFISLHDGSPPENYPTSPFFSYLLAGDKEYNHNF